MGTDENDYDKYIRILDIVWRSAATMLAIIFAYALSVGRWNISLQLYMTLLVVGLITAALVSGIGIIFGRKSEPRTLKGLAIASFLIMIILFIGMLILLLLVIYGSA